MNPEERRAYMKKYREEHREELNAYNRKYLSWQTRNILRAHKDALSDDPERLTTDFIMKIVKGGL